MSSATRARIALIIVTAAVAALIGIATATGSAPCSSTPLAPSCFEAHDGDLAASAGRLDWENIGSTASSDPGVPHEITLSDATGTGDDVFESGQKENAESSGWKIEAQKSSAKTDIRRGVFARDVVGDDVLFYAGLERAGTTGSQNLSVELNRKSPVTRSTTVGDRLVPDRSDDDLLIVFDGSLDDASKSSIGFCKWRSTGPSGPGWYGIDGAGAPTDDRLGGSTDCTPLGDLNKPTAAAGRAGVGALPNPGLLAGFNSPIPAGTFGEVGVNLTELLTGGATTSRCFSYGSVFMHSRSSDSGTANMEDYVAPKAIPATGTCAIDVEKTVSTSAAGPFGTTASARPGDTLHYRLTATNSGTVPLDAPTPADTASWSGPAAGTISTTCGAPALSQRLRADGSPDADGTFDPGDRWTWTCSASGGFVENGSYANSLVVSGTPATGGSAVSSQPARAVVTFPQADRSMSVAKTVATSAAGPFVSSVSGASATSPLYYRVAVTNTGTVPLSGVQLADTGLSDPDAGGPNAGSARNPGCAGLTDADGTLLPPDPALSTGANGSLDPGETWVWACSQSPTAGAFAYSGTYRNTAFASATPVTGGVQVSATPGSATATFAAKPADGGTPAGGGTATAGGSSSGGGSVITTVADSSDSRLLSTSKEKTCISKRYRLDIVGGPIAKVTFLVDGKVRKVVTRPGAGGRFSFDVNPSLKDTKRHNVQVRIEYVPSSGRKTKVLNHVYQRCGCASRRNFRIRVKTKRKDPVVRATVLVNGKRVKVLRGRRLTAPVRLTGLPKGRFIVKVVATTRSGKRQVDERRYMTCTKKKPAKKRR